METGNGLEKINGYVDHVIFQNSENGYTVMILVTDDEEEITCVGMLKGLGKGETIACEGRFIEHPLYGRQFKIESYEAVVPKSALDMERYLGSGAIKGVGETLARRIVRKFKDDTFRIIEEEPERLAEIKGISERMAREIAIQIEERRDLRDALVFLGGYGISNAMAVKIYKTYGVEIYRVLRENPYRLAEDVQGVGFRIADEIASQAGISPDSDYRIRCGIFYTLQEALRDGHCYLPRDLLLQRARGLLEVDEERIDIQIDNMIMDRKLILKKEGVFAQTMYYTELDCAAMLHRLNEPMEGTELLPSAENALDKRLERLVGSLKMELDDLQLLAVKKSIENGVFILSGGPGTGKTTTINLMIRYFEEEGLDILLAAPTGRAAKRMTEATGMEARTIHRMLELNSDLSDEDTHRVSFERNEENPLEADVIIIDEMSMVDVRLFRSLLKAVEPGTRLILVGDVDQLPSVGPGQVLKDLLRSECFEAVVLDRVFRQAGESDIVVNAHKINKGQHIVFDNKSKDFFLLKRNDVNVIYKHMLQLILEKLPGYVGAEAFDIQVLTPMRKGALGCETLNAVLQKYLNPPAPGKREYTSGDTVFREGDKVMQIKNNYQLEWEIVSRYNIPIDSGTGIFNGDMGRIVEIREESNLLIVEFDEKRRVSYSLTMLDELELSYAITIHKAQGSEFPAVILPLLSGPRMLFNRNLLYTGITRARNCVMILGSPEVVDEMIDNVSENRRFSALSLRLKELAAVAE